MHDAQKPGYVVPLPERQHLCHDVHRRLYATRHDLRLAGFLVLFLTHDDEICCACREHAQACIVEPAYLSRLGNEHKMLVLRVADGVPVFVRCLSKGIYHFTDAPRHIWPAFDDAPDIRAAVLVADQHVAARLAHWPVAGLLFVRIFTFVPQVLKRPRVRRTVAVSTAFVPIATVHFFGCDFDGQAEAPYADAGKR